MALNCSHRPCFVAHLPEDNLVSPMRIGVSEKNGVGRPWQEPVAKDIIDSLPSDPFGMDISNTFTALTGWLEDLKLDYGGYGRDEVGTSNGDYELFAGLNFIWNNAMMFQRFPRDNGADCKPKFGSGFSNCGLAKEKQVVVDPCCHGGCSEQARDAACGDVFDDCSKDMGVSGACDVSSYQADIGSACAAGFSGQQNVVDEAHDEALFFALSYLGVRDLLAVEAVCKSLYSTVRGDPFVWRSIHIDQPLNEKMTDEILLQLTDRAQGNLQCLSLVECAKITDNGLKRVLENNPKLTKLSVPGCTRLSIEGIVNNLRAFKSKSTQGVKQLRIGGIYGVTQRHFEELKFLLGTDQMQQNARKPHFYHRWNFYLSCDDDSDIDIEMCPRCQNLRLVYDCPEEACQGKEHPTQICRACTLCIGRCADCGRCINDSEYEETFCLELLCSDCWKQLSVSEEGEDIGFVSSDSAVLYEQNQSLCHDG